MESRPWWKTFVTPGLVLIVYQAASPHVQSIIESGGSADAYLNLGWIILGAILVEVGDIQSANSDKRVYTPKGLPGLTRSSKQSSYQEYDPKTRH